MNWNIRRHFRHLFRLLGGKGGQKRPRPDHSPAMRFSDLVIPEKCHSNQTLSCQVRFHGQPATEFRTGPQLQELRIQWTNTADGTEGEGARPDINSRLSSAGKHVLEFTVKAPATGGRWRLLVQPGDQSGIRPISGLVEVENFDGPCAGSVEIADSPASCLAGHPFAIRVTIRNASDQIWHCHGPDAVRLAWRWRGTPGSALPADPGRSKLPVDLAPGASLDHVFFAEASNEEGDYHLNTTLVRVTGERFEWAGTFSPGRTRISVRSRSALGADRLADDEHRNSHLGLLGNQLAYSAWLTVHEPPSLQERSLAQRVSSGWDRPPLISFLMPVRDPPISALREAIDSVLAQTYQTWELCLHDDGSLTEDVVELLKKVASADSRIRLSRSDQSRGISSASNSALALASGTFCLLVDHDDLIAPWTGFLIAGIAHRDPQIQWIYGDMDRLDQQGNRHSPFLWPGPDPLLCRAFPYMSAHAAYSVPLLRDLGGFRQPFDGSQDHDLGLRVMERIGLEHAAHIPHILYHWRDTPGSYSRNPATSLTCASAGQAAIDDHLQRIGVEGTAHSIHERPGYRIRLAPPNPKPLVSIIIPTRDRVELLRPCLFSLLERTTWAPFEIVIVDNGSAQPSTLEYLSRLEKRKIATIVRHDAPFNWSELCNLGATHAKGQVLCFLNNDTEVVSPDWLEELVSLAYQPGVGPVGPALTFPDGRLQHAGVRHVPGRYATNIQSQNRQPVSRPWHLGLTRTVDAVTGACLLVRKPVFEESGRFDQTHVPIGFSDVEFCLRVERDLGLASAWTPFATLIHAESQSRGTGPEESKRPENLQACQYLSAHWRERLDESRYWSPYLEQTGSDRLAARPLASLAADLHAFDAKKTRVLHVIHIPKTAGSSLRTGIDTILPGRVLSLSGGTILTCLDGDLTAHTRVKAALRRTGVLFCHARHGFTDLLGIPAVHVAMLRDPVQRILSHWRHLTTREDSLIFGSSLSDLPIPELLRLGILPSNLMTKMLLGGRSEQASWLEVHSGPHAHSAGMVGFDLPTWVWKGLPPPHEGPTPGCEGDGNADEIVASCLGQCAFIGLQEQLEEHAKLLFAALGWPQAPLPTLNSGRHDAPITIDPTWINAIESYNKLDRALYDRVASMPGGCCINREALLTVSSNRLPTQESRS